VLGILAFLTGSDLRYRERTSPRAIIRIAILASSLFAVLASLYAYSPTWSKAYRWIFRNVGDVAFSQFWIWPRASIDFVDLDSPTLMEEIRSSGLPPNAPVRGPDGVKHTLLLLKNSDERHRWIGQLRTSAKIIGYWPTAMVLSLAIVTPWPWKRKRWVILGCLVAVHAFIILRLTIFALKGGFAVPTKSLRLFTPSDFWGGLLKRLDEVVNDDPTFNFIAAFVIWIGVLVVMGVLRSRRETRALRVESRRALQPPQRRRRR